VTQTSGRTMQKTVATRLREARLEAGLSSRSVAMGLPARLKLSHATLHSYERGLTSPPLPILAILADFYGRPLNWFLQRSEGLSGFRYRNEKSRVSLTDKRRFQAQSAKWVDAYIGLEHRLKDPLRNLRRNFSVDPSLPGKKLAEKVRAELALRDDEPVVNVISVLEGFGIRTLEMPTELRVDGMAARWGASFVIVLNPNTSNDRLRMNAAHELAHVLYDDCKEMLGWKDADVEKRAYDFASSLLLPTTQLEEAFKGKSFIRLIEFKERFGISLAAMIYRGQLRRLIRPSQARWLWTEFSRKGWRKQEPGHVWRDRALRFERLLETAIAMRELTWKEAEEATGVREEELKLRISAALGGGTVVDEEGGDGPPSVLEFRPE
jgi:Zn-dependent peptidase ImmA (M78 family)